MEPSWDDLRIFLSLARGGTLTTAAKALGVSHPTVARRVQALEKQIGARLFERLPDRFVPTAAGEELLADTEAMEKAALSINRRSAGLSDTVSGVVRLSAGEAMAAWLASHLPELRKGLAQIEFELTASHTLANLSRREADLLIREQVPDLHGIVTRKLGRVAYAIYGHRTLVRAVTELRTMPWIGFDDDHLYMPGQRWLHELLGGAKPAVRGKSKTNQRQYDQRTLQAVHVRLSRFVTGTIAPSSNARSRWNNTITASITARTRGSARRSRCTSSHWSANTSGSTSPSLCNCGSGSPR
jgi:DNA-binding transcriptional LysR family regulator